MKFATLDAVLEASLTKLRDFQRARRDATRRRMESDGEPAEFVDEVIASFQAFDDAAAVEVTPDTRSCLEVSTASGSESPVRSIEPRLLLTSACIATNDPAITCRVQRSPNQRRPQRAVSACGNRRAHDTEV